MKPRRPSLPLALLFGLALLAPPTPLPFRSSSTLPLCAAATPLSPADAPPVADVPHHDDRRSLWELSVVWDKVGQFFARLTSGWHTDKDTDCAQKKAKDSSLSGMTSLASSGRNETTAATTATPANYTTTASRLRRQLEMEEKQRALKLVQVAHSAEVTRHERVWAKDVDRANDNDDDDDSATLTATPEKKPTLLGEHMEHHASWSTMLQEVPDDDAVAAETDKDAHRQLLLYPEDLEMMHSKADDEEEEDRGPYYSKDEGQWYGQTHHTRPLAGLKKHGHGHGHRHLAAPQATVGMTDAEYAAIREEAREALVEALRQASKEKEVQRTDPNVAKSLDSVLDALAVRRPMVGLHGEKKATAATSTKTATLQEEKLLSRLRLPGMGGVLGTEPDVANPLPPGRRRSLRGLQQQSAGAGVAAAIASGFTEQQKAEMRQIFYDAALSMVREAAREALNTNQGGNAGGTNYYPTPQNKNGPLSQDAYAAAYNAFLNAVSSKEQTAGAGTAASVDVPGPVASHYGGPGGVGPTDVVNTGRGGAGGSGGGGVSVAKKQGFLEVAREVARHNSPSAGRPPSRLRGGGRRALKDMALRIPVPFSRDESSANGTLKINATDAVFIPLRYTDPSVQEAAFKRLGPLGPIIEGSPQALGGETVHDDPPCPLPGAGHVYNPLNKDKKMGDHEWAELLLALVHEHQEKKEQQQQEQEQRATRFLEGTEAAPPAAPAAADGSPSSPPPASPPTSQDTTTNPPTLTALPNPNPPNGVLDLNALANILQRPWVGPVPGGMGDQEQPPTAPETDALGNVIQKMKGGGGKEKEEEEGEKKKEEEIEEEGGRVPGGGWYDRASSQLMSHSARNFQKMQEAVRLGGWVGGLMDGGACVYSHLPTYLYSPAHPPTLPTGE